MAVVCESGRVGSGGFLVVGCRYGPDELVVLCWLTVVGLVEMVLVEHLYSGRSARDLA